VNYPRDEKLLESHKVSRRDFGRGTLTTVFSLAQPTLLFPGQTSVREVKPKAKPSKDNSSELSAEQIAEIEARFANIVRKYGNRLSEVQHEHLHQILTYSEKMLASIRAFPLQNSDPPRQCIENFSFRAHREIEISQ
jgi:hypothetical protein